MFRLLVSLCLACPGTGQGLSPVAAVLGSSNTDDVYRPTWGESIDGPTEMDGSGDGDGDTRYRQYTCHDGCQCNTIREKGFLTSVECVGEHITSISQLNLPDNTMHLFLTETSVEELSPASFANLTVLKSITMKHNLKLRNIQPRTFHNMQEVGGIEITHSPMLTEVGPDVFGMVPHLVSLSFDNCGLTKVPNLTDLRPSLVTLKNLILSNNKIFALEPYTFSGLSFEIYNLDLSGNDISSVSGNAFDGAKIYKLILSHNPIDYVNDDTFGGIVGLRELFMSDTSITKLPTLGLKNIVLLDIQNTPNLKHFPPLFKFQSIKTVRLHYFSHCCAFYYPTLENTHMANMYNITEPIESAACSTTPNPDVDDDARDTSIPRNSWAHMVDDDYSQDARSSERMSFPLNAFFHPPSNGSLMTNAPAGDQPDRGDSSFDGGFIGEPINPNTTHITVGGSCGGIVPKNYSKVNCSPRPDAFNPCSDVMGYSFLRVIVWFIASTAMAGNLVVMVVLIAYRHKMTVPKFLMCNLAFADFCMGIYLLMVAAVDVHTLGVYFNYAIDWQFGAGCKIAGFISVFSSELSVFTLTVLTIERWYTIIYAIDLNKRIRLRQAGRILLGGWFFGIIIASLPFMGVAGYGVTSLCLPFYVRKNDSAAAVAYVIFILLFNALAFIVICGCYVKMYVTVRNPHSVMQRKDSKVAKRMAVLIFTDLACWAPIAINGLSSIFSGENAFLTTDQAKVFIVLFYPINSCANPFLYAIFTRAFRRDMFLLLAKHGMCEKRAMKYRPTCTSSPRTMSQVNSTTVRDGALKGSHRGSSASVMTQITSDARPSTVSCEKESPDNSPKTNIELQLVVTVGNNNSHHSLPPSETAPNHWEVASSAPSTSSKLGGSKKQNDHVYVVDGLPPVLEEHNGERQEFVPSSPPVKTKHDENRRLYRRQGSPRIVEPHRTDEDDAGGKESSSLLSQAAGDDGNRDTLATKKDSRTDSGTQSVTTSPTDRDIASKVMQINLAKSDDFETTL